MGKYSDPQIKEAVANSNSYAGAQRYLGLSTRSGGERTWLKRKILLLGLDISHFQSAGEWNKGTICYKTDEVFAENSRAPRQKVRKYILRDNLIPYECAFCGNKGEWLGKPMAQELDHINGVPNDHRLENLRFLCPNCHATTDTYCGRNIRKNKQKNDSADGEPLDDN